MIFLDIEKFNVTALDVGLLIVRDEKIDFADESALVLLNCTKEILGQSIYSVLPGYQPPQLNGIIDKTLIKTDSHELSVSSVLISKIIIVILYPHNQNTVIPDAKTQNLQAFFEYFSFLDSFFSNVLITNGQGIIIYVSPNWGVPINVSKEEALGKSVFEFEEKKVFYPSGTRMAIEKRQKVTFVQSTKDNKLWVTSIPFFNKETGEPEYVISYSIFDADFQVIQKQYDQMEKLVQKYSSEITQLREKEMTFPDIISKSPQMQEVLNLALKVAKVDTNILITGESGVGKTIIGRLIHKNSTRSNGPFIEINCSTIPDNLMESELFGYTPGAFTGALREGKIGLIEMANEGTLLLDEIGELNINLQAKLLKVIQEKTVSKIGSVKATKVDFRLIAATNQNLYEMVEAGLFREDLFYRLNVVPILIPSLRERTEDIIPLIFYYLGQANKQYDRNVNFSKRALEILLAYNWPGNVRELQNLVERLVITTDEKVIQEDCLPKNIRISSMFHVGTDLSLKSTLEMVEKQLVQNAYAQYKTTIGVSKSLGISQSSAVRKLQKYIKGYS